MSPAQPDWLGIAIGSGISIASILISMFWTPIGSRRMRRRPDFRTAFDGVLIAVPKSFTGLKLSYKNKSMTRVARSRLAFWNDSGDPLRRTDTIPNDPLRVVVNEGDEILQARLVSRSRPQCEIEISPKGVITFELLDEGDGAIVEVLHRGPAHASIVGTMAGTRIAEPVVAQLGPGARNAVRTPRIRRYALMHAPGKRRMVFFTIAGILAIGVIIGGVSLALPGLGTPVLVSPKDFDLTTLLGQREYADAIGRSGSRNWPNIIFGIAALVMGSVMLGLMVRRVYGPTKAVVPRSIVEDDLDPWTPPVNSNSAPDLGTD